MNEDIRKVTEEDMKNLFWQLTLSSIRQDKLIKALNERLRESELQEAELSSLLDFKQATHGAS